MKNTIAQDILSKTIIKIDGAYAPATIRAYRGNFESFISFCDKQQENALPASPEIVSEYVKKLSDGRLKSASIRIAIASISALHRLNRLDDPTQDPIVKIEMRRMHRKLGREQKQAYGINKELLQKMLNSLDYSLNSIRDRAILHLAYEGLCRRSEIVSIKIEDLVFFYSNDHISNLKIKLRKSKTDQEGFGKWLQIGDDGQKAVIKWIETSHIKNGYLFRAIDKSGNLSEKLSASQINKIFKKISKAMKLPAEIIKHVSGHSMRVGAAQDLLISGKSLPLIMVKGRWSKSDTVMRYLEYATTKCN